MGVQGGNAPLKIQFNLKTYSPSRACEGLYLLYGWVREGGERAPVALCREPTEPAGETGVGFTKPRQGQVSEGVGLIKLPSQAGETGVGFTQGDPQRRGWQQERGPEHCLQPCGLV